MGGVSDATLAKQSVHGDARSMYSQNIIRDLSHNKLVIYT